MDQPIIDCKIEALGNVASETLASLGPWEARHGIHRGPGRYDFATDWTELRLPAAWPALTTVFLRTRLDFTPPSESDIELVFDHDALEGAVSLDGRPYTGMDRWHSRVAAPAGPAELVIEAIAVAGAMSRPERRGLKGTFRGAHLVRVDRAAHTAWLDLDYARRACVDIEPGRRRSLLREALEQALFTIDLTADRAHLLAQLTAAGQRLRERIAVIGRDAEGGRIFAVGHTHIDTAWLWPVRETIRKCARTFSSACRLMEAYPDFHFSCSQAQLYAFTQQHYPSLFEEIRHWVKEGRWHTTGAMWVEADCNVTSGESLVRQILHGLSFFAREFGQRPRCCWLPDVFGYPASLPQILKRAGLPYFFTYKLHWQSRNRFPAHLFQWEGIDGSRVLGHVPLLRAAYNGFPTPEQLRFAWDNFAQKDQYPEMLFSYGHGDGGGGPTAEMIEHFRRAMDYPGLPQCRTGSEEQFFRDADESGRITRVWRGELYLETHRGTYTTHADAKTGNRRCELALRDAEILAAAAAWRAHAVDTSPLRDAWQLTLLNQFHDILPGTSIGEVYADMRADHTKALQRAEDVSRAAVDALTEPDADALFVTNTCGWSRNDPVVVRIPAPSGPVTVVDPAGTRLPTQVEEAGDGGVDLAFQPDAMAGFSGSTFHVLAARADSDAPIRVEDRRIETDLYLIEFADDGAMTRILDKGAKRELVPAGKRMNELQFFQDGPGPHAAWNIEADYNRAPYAADPHATFEAIAQGPVRGILRVTRRFRDSTFVQDVVVYRSLRRIDIATRADWRERQVLAKAAFAMDVHAASATFDIQFGAVERPIHKNTSWDEEKFEVCGQRWADLSETGYGISVLNDCKYGHDVEGNVLRLTLLRGTEWPDPEADRGRHHFTYALLPHTGNWVVGETVRRAMELNVPMRAHHGRRGAAGDGTWIRVTGGPVIADTLKPAEDGNGWILRLYEPHGGRGEVTVQLMNRAAEVVETNLAEENEKPLPLCDGAFKVTVRPFEIRTFRLFDCECACAGHPKILR